MGVKPFSLKSGQNGDFFHHYLAQGWKFKNRLGYSPILNPTIHAKFQVSTISQLVCRGGGGGTSSYLRYPVCLLSTICRPSWLPSRLPSDWSPAHPLDFLRHAKIDQWFFSIVERLKTSVKDRYDFELFYCIAIPTIQRHIFEAINQVAYHCDISTPKSDILPACLYECLSVRHYLGI